MEDLSKLSKKELLALLEAKLAEENTTGAGVEKTASPEEDSDRVRLLESALVSTANRARAAKALAEKVNEEEIHEVTSAKDVALSVHVRDRRGDTVLVRFPKRNAKALLTTSQIVELQTEKPWLFKKGYLIAPDLVDPSPNAIPDQLSFLESLAIHDIPRVIGSIDDVGTLRELYHFIDSLRFQFVEEGDKTVVKQVAIDPKYQVVQHAVADKVRELSGMQLTVDPSR